MKTSFGLLIEMKDTLRAVAARGHVTFKGNLIHPVDAKTGTVAQV
jgi:hypothetical protein